MATVEAPISVEEANAHLDPLFEVVDGVVVKKRVGTWELVTANVLQSWLAIYLLRNRVGFSFVETSFRMSDRTDRVRRPDFAFVAQSRLPAQGDELETPWRLAPDGAAEVVSRHDEFYEVFDKIREYFDAGVRLVWIVMPRYGWVHVYESPLGMRCLTRGDTLDGGDVLPGFRLPLVDLFAVGFRAES